mmetsp:Transcript_3757/g.10759  ORF Transcript_3757/g.10759 Transcript_3757/m.10759 type:complete len:498 (+) Transcript_3757:2759-4252(+)
MLVIDLPYARAEHDGLQPLPPLAVRKPLPEGTGIPLDQRLSKFVAVVRGPVAGIDQNLQRGRQALWIRLLAIFPRMEVVVHVQVAHAVPGRSSGQQRPDACGVRVPHPAAGTRLSPGVGGHGTGEVVRLRSEENVVILLLHLQRAGLSRVAGLKPVDLEALDGTRVVLESDHAVAGVFLQGVLDDVEKALVLFFFVDGQIPLEEPVPAMLAVGLAQVEELDVRGVPPDLVAEQVHVVVDVPVVKGQAHLLVDVLQGLPPLLDHRDGEHGGGDHVALEALQGPLVDLLGHPVVDELRELLPLLRGQAGGPSVGEGEPEPAGPLRPANVLLQAAGLENGHGVRAPRRAEAHARPDLHNAPPVGAEGALVGQPVQLKRLAQQPQHRLARAAIQGLPHLQVEAGLGLDRLDRRGDLRTRLGEERLERLPRQQRSSIQLEHPASWSRDQSVQSGRRDARPALRAERHRPGGDLAGIGRTGGPRAPLTAAVHDNTPAAQRRRR